MYHYTFAKVSSCSDHTGHDIYSTLGRPVKGRNGITDHNIRRSMRVFTDGSCTNNGRPGAKAGYAVWFPEHPDWSESHRIPDTEEQTNNRAELSAIRRAVQILESKGYLDEDIVIYTDSNYSINCLSVWITGWLARGWKTSDGKPVLNRDLIEQTTAILARFKTHRFHHVRAHTGGHDDLSVQNDRVDRMAREIVDGVKPVVVRGPTEELLPGCPLAVMGPAVSQVQLMTWIRENIDAMDSEVVNKHLFKAFVETAKAKNVTLSKSTVQKRVMLKAELATVVIEKCSEDVA
jgi:ribonuclease HI